MKEKKLKIFIALLSLAIIFSGSLGLLLAAATKFALFGVFLSLTPTLPLLGETNILVLGVDHAFGSRSDTIMLLHVNPPKKEASVISIPRDTLVSIPGP